MTTSMDWDIGQTWSIEVWAGNGPKAGDGKMCVIVFGLDVVERIGLCHIEMPYRTSHIRGHCDIVDVHEFRLL